MSDTPETLAATLAGLIAAGRPVARILVMGPLRADADDVLAEMAETLDDLTAERDRMRRSTAPGTSVAEMLRNAQALRRVADAADHALVPLLTRLEAAGATLDLRPGLASAADHRRGVDSIHGVEILIRPLPH